MERLPISFFGNVNNGLRKQKASIQSLHCDKRKRLSRLLSQMRLPVAHCLEEKAKKTIAGSTDRLNFASEKNKSRFVLTQKKELITIKKIRL